MVMCGCGKEAKYEVYEHNEPHCLECLLDAIDCSVYVHVRRLDELAKRDTDKIQRIIRGSTSLIESRRKDSTRGKTKVRFPERKSLSTIPDL